MSSISSSQPAVVDAAEFTVRRTIRIAAPVEKVWSAVTEPEHISRWFGRTELDGSGAGARGTMTFAERGSIPLRVEAMDQPRLVTYRWNNDDALERLPGELDVDHSTVAWDHVVVGQSILAGTPFEPSMVKNGIDATSVEGVADSPYLDDDRRRAASTLHSPSTRDAGARGGARSATRTPRSRWRAMIDELAHAARQGSARVPARAARGASRAMPRRSSWPPRRRAGARRRPRARARPRGARVVRQHRRRGGRGLGREGRDPGAPGRVRRRLRHRGEPARRRGAGAGRRRVRPLRGAARQAHARRTAGCSRATSTTTRSLRMYEMPAVEVHIIAERREDGRHRRAGDRADRAGRRERGVRADRAAAAHAAASTLASEDAHEAADRCSSFVLRLAACVVACGRRRAHRRRRRRARGARRVRDRAQRAPASALPELPPRRRRAAARRRRPPPQAERAARPRRQRHAPARSARRATARRIRRAATASTCRPASRTGWHMPPPDEKLVFVGVAPGELCGADRSRAQRRQGHGRAPRASRQAARSRGAGTRLRPRAGPDPARGVPRRVGDLGRGGRAVSALIAVLRSS